MAITLTVTRKNNLVVIAAWGFMLLGSILPEIILHEVLHRSDLVAWLTSGRLVTLAVLTAVSWLWQPLRPLWKYAAILLVFAGGQEVMNRVRETAVWQNTLNQWGSSFARDYLAVQVWKLGSTAIVLVGLFALGFRRKDAFLVRGQLDAPITPVKWLGFPKPEPWTHFGAKWIVFLSIGMVVLLNIFGTVHLDSLMAALGMMPVILILSALNAFNEEVTYRSAQLAPLEPAVGSRQALWITAVLFAIMHYYSAINGVAGVILTIFMGWMLSKAMLETRGFFWSWLIHFTQDVVIFWFIAGSSTILS
ncbi:MAG: CPBP family intramembrane glutamic endopeptidase [Chloroflexota bacterium]